MRLLAWSALAAAGVVVLVVRLRRRYVEVTVDGTSMAPTYQPGDRVLVRRAHLPDLRVGDIVVLRHPDSRRGTWLIKRVAALPGDAVPTALRSRLGGETTVPAGEVVVLGDAGKRSYDSKHFGSVPAERVLGVAIRIA
ncbi:signal peptidase I [Nonomuraea sp. NPDC050556]|uniref:signal peptidase I n=1 Tax=Nonomuraea sp. NPDC050556 TaxID=3364369 RepID=UPI0037A99923